MNTTDTTLIQATLFPDTEHSLENTHNYQIKRTDNVEFGLHMTVTGDEDPETKALEQLGYFVVPETSIF